MTSRSHPFLLVHFLCILSLKVVLEKKLVDFQNGKAFRQISLIYPLKAVFGMKTVCR